MQTDFILIKQLTMRLSGQEILHDLDLSIAAGATVAIVGDNGTGKTTLIKLLAGLLTPKQGSISINNLSYNKSLEAIQIKQLLGYAPDTPPLYPNDTVQTYLQYMAHLKQVPKELMQARIDEYMGLFDLISIRKQQLYRLSKGMQQRVNLAQALLNKPKLLLLDEPTNALDEQQVTTFVEHIRLLQQQGITIILATHNYTEIIPLCAYLLKTHSGKLQKIMLPVSTTNRVWQHDQIYTPA